MMVLTKSEYLLFLKHRAWLWLKKHDKAKLPPIDANTQAKFDAGNRLEVYAEQLFPNGVRLGFSSFDEYQTLSHRTQQAIVNNTPVIFQGRLDTEQLTCLPDVLEFIGPNRLNLYEIKSSTSVKPEHEYDLAFQVEVLEGCGYEVEIISVIHVNNKYVRQGEIDPHRLFTITDISEKVRGLRDITKTHIEQALNVIALPKLPSLSPRYCRLGSMEDWLGIYRSLVDVPELSIYDLANPSPDLIGELEDLNVFLLKDIPDGMNLTPTQQTQVKAVKDGKHGVDKKKINAFLDTLVYPLYFFDYETCMDAIPLYDGTRPYQQVTCQYSLHIIETPGGDIRHTEFIHRTPDSPALSLAESLKRDIGPTGSVIVWYATFETSRNKEMAEMLPEFAEFFIDINERVVDLMIPFSKGMYVDPAFLGSASIKKVLPVLVPELSYKELEVQEGKTAQRLWMQAVLEGKGTSAENEKLFQDLLSYCELDTLAMVRIYEKLISVSTEKYKVDSHGRD